MNCHLILPKIGFWRSSIRPFSAFPFTQTSNEHDLIDLARVTLTSDSVICKWLEQLLQRPDGHYCKLLNLKENSDSKRELFYTIQLLISSVIRNDTGIHGAISIVPIREYDKLKYDCPAEPNIILPNQVKVIILNSNDNILDVLTKRNKGDYLIPTYDSQRLYIEQKKVDEIISSSNRMIEYYEKQYVFHDKRIVVYAIDFLRNGNKWIPIETHFPGRGIGLHFLSLLKTSLLNSELVKLSLLDIRQNIILKYSQCGLNDNLELPKTIFHEMDLLFCKTLKLLVESNNSGIIDNNIINITCEISNNYDESNIPTRDIKIPIPELTKLLTIKTDRTVMNKVQDYGEKYGPWIIIKQRTNYPWWHKKRIRPVIINPKIEIMRRIALKILSSGDSIIEPVISSSLDQYGHSGELRFYFISMLG